MAIGGHPIYYLQKFSEAETDLHYQLIGIKVIEALFKQSV